MSTYDILANAFELVLGIVAFAIVGVLSHPIGLGLLGGLIVLAGLVPRLSVARLFVGTFLLLLTFG